MIGRTTGFSDGRAINMLNIHSCRLPHGGPPERSLQLVPSVTPPLACGCLSLMSPSDLWDRRLLQYPTAGNSIGPQTFHSTRTICSRELHYTDYDKTGCCFGRCQQ